jgi:hypothetical protein
MTCGEGQPAKKSSYVVRSARAQIGRTATSRIRTGAALCRGLTVKGELG